VYEPPHEVPSRTDHVIPQESVALDPAIDPRKAPTQRKLRHPIDVKDTIPDLVRREPTLRGLHAGAPTADEAPSSGGPAPVIVPGPDGPGWVEEPTSEQPDPEVQQIPVRSIEFAQDAEDAPPAAPMQVRALPRTNHAGKLVAVVAGIAVIVVLVLVARARTEDPPAPLTTTATNRRAEPIVQPTLTTPGVAEPIAPVSDRPAPEPVPSAAALPEKRRPPKLATPTATPSSGSAKPPAPPDPDRPFL
jgi:hypothetical protein